MAEAPKIFNYSKWDKIELSDDESDLHPNIDKESWFRLKHRTRLEREEKEDKEVKEYEKLNSEDQARLNIIIARLQGIKSGLSEDADAQFEDVDALDIEADELKKRIQSRKARISDIQERRKWNIDNICKTKDEKTVVSKAEPASLRASDFKPTGLTSAALSDSNQQSSESIPSVKAPTAPVPQASSSSSHQSNIAKTPAASTSGTIGAKTPAASTSATIGPRGDSPTRERFQVVSYNDFAHAYTDILETFSEIQDLDATKEYLFKNCDILLHEHAQAYMLLSSLEDEMNGKRVRMKLVCRQSQILTHIQELGNSMRRDPRDVIIPFFKRIEEPEHFKAFSAAVEDFAKKIFARAIEKRKEMAEEEKNEQPKGPGGLDPFEVIESLPASLREAFESQDLGKLQAVLATMDAAEAKHHMKRCVDSGLWVPRDKSIFEGEEQEEDA